MDDDDFPGDLYLDEPPKPSEEPKQTPVEDLTLPPSFWDNNLDDEASDQPKQTPVEDQTMDSETLPSSFWENISIHPQSSEPSSYPSELPGRDW
jgi:hypothetical protein